ncbi:TonB-dependent receptor domain-containing protein [Mesorhizobium sp. ANAO-SY3R2]|uniref:TonB-dependent receptor domain-containing protein n=1 Tax=Mesorhizobium sp. ANAO-SY3R2 TaxID=3166644 RepID=UPI00366FFD36
MGLVARNKTALLGGAAIMVLVGLQAANAQEAQTNEQDKNGRVTLLQRLVIGTGLDKVAIDTPQSVTVIDQEDIDRRQPETIGEIFRDIPGINITGSERLLGQSFNIRGIGAPENTGDGGRIIVNVDGAQKFYEQYRLGSFFSEPELYQRAEVLRGPASSTLYGSGALGGVINFETKDASDFIAEGQNGALRLKSSWNSNGNGYLLSSVLAQRWGENAEFLLTGNSRASDVYTSGNGNEILGTNFKAWSGLAKGTFNVGDEGTLRLSYQQWDSDLDDQQLSQTSATAFFGLIDRHIVDQTAIASYENPFADNDMLDVKLSASYSNTHNEQRNADMRAACGTGSMAVVCDSNYAYETWQFNAQNTMEWVGDSWTNHFTFGSQTGYQTRVAEAFFNDGTQFPVAFHPEGTDLKTGVFAQNEFVWDDRLTIIPGMRLDWHKLTPDSALDAPSSDDTAFSPKIAALYKFNDTFSVFGSVAHTERFPTIDEVFSTASSSSTFLPSLGLKKEQSNNFEAGFALSGSDLLQAGDAGQLKVTSFFNAVTDLIALNRPFTAGFNNKPGFINIEEAEIYGFEVEAAYDADYVFANAGYSYVVGKNKQTGAYLTTVAPHELALTLGGKMPDHDVTFGWKARFVAGPQDPARDRNTPPVGDPNSTRFATAFDVHDIFLTWKPQDGQLAGWETNLGVDNLFDRQYKEFLMNDDAKGRTFKISLSKELGW